MMTSAHSSTDYAARLRGIKKDLIGKWLAVSRDLPKTYRNGTKAAQNFAFVRKERARLQALGYVTWVPNSDRLTLHRRIELSDFEDYYSDTFERWVRLLYLNSRVKDIRVPVGIKSAAGFNPNKSYVKEIGEISPQKCKRMRAAFATGKKIEEICKWHMCGRETVARHVHGRCDHE